jgi:ParB-like chromosome segregation protein Spo0J
MTVETVAIDAIQIDPANLRRHPERNLAAIKGSLARFGQQRPIIVDHRGIIIAGNGTYSAARQLGWSEIKIVRTELQGSEAVAFGIADNRTSETGEWDQQGLADVLSALRAEDADLAAAAGFTPDELAELLGERQTPGTDQPPEEFPAYGEDIATNCKCPKCGYEWSDGKK